MDYFKFVGFLKMAKLVVSDGGSNQEECSYLGKPIILFRSATERFEGIGDNCLVSEYSEEKVIGFVSSLEFYEKEINDVKVSPSDVVVDSLSRL